MKPIDFSLNILLKTFAGIKQNLEFRENKFATLNIFKTFSFVKKAKPI